MTLTGYTKCVFLVLNLITYVAMLSLGIYFIYQGAVIPRYFNKRTYWAANEEIISELPSVVTWIHPYNSTLKLGEDFQIQYRSSTSNPIYKGINLTYGENNVMDSNLKVQLEKLFHPNMFKITPLNFSPGIFHDYLITYIFADKTLMQSSEIGLILSTENGTMHCNHGKYYDGDVKASFSKLGKLNYLTIAPSKFIMLKTTNNCREKPYTQLFVEYFLQIIKEKCPTPCKTKSYLRKCQGFGLSKGMEELSLCKTKRDNECFHHSFLDTRYIVNQQQQACTILQYDITNTYQVQYEKHKQHLTTFDWSFSPDKVQVFEQYLIFDTIAMVSAIGGTLGLCIGFSFTDMANTILSKTEQFVEYIRSRRIINQSAKRNPRGIKIRPENIIKQIQKLEILAETQKQIIAELASFKEESERRYVSLENRVN